MPRYLISLSHCLLLHLLYGPPTLGGVSAFSFVPCPNSQVHKPDQPNQSESMPGKVSMRMNQLVRRIIVKDVVNFGSVEVVNELDKCYGITRLR